jgi:hypothetical protein
MWINKKKARAPADVVLVELNKYKVEEADLDNNLIKEVRSDVMNFKLKTNLKDWVRKYPTPQQKRNHPFEILKNDMKEFLKEYGITMLRKTNNAGNHSVSHYMTLLQN